MLLCPTGHHHCQRLNAGSFILLHYSLLSSFQYQGRPCVSKLVTTSSSVLTRTGIVVPFPFLPLYRTGINITIGISSVSPVYSRMESRQA
jgi:hypothetical protein